MFCSQRGGGDSANPSQPLKLHLAEFSEYGATVPPVGVCGGQTVLEEFTPTQAGDSF